MTSFGDDLRLAARALLRAPGFTLVAVLTLALGIGATAAIYTLLERVVVDPLPYPESGRLVRLKSPVPGVDAGEEWQLSAAGFFHFQKARTLDGLGGYQRDGASVQTGSGTQRVAAAMGTAGLFPLLGARAALGRTIGPDDDRPDAPAVVVLSHGFWRLQFGGDPGVVGRVLRVNEEPMEVVGVMEPGVVLPGEPGAAAPQPDLWMAMRMDPAGPFYNSHVVPAVARLAPGVTLEQAQDELSRMTAALPDLFPGVYSPGFMEKYGFSTRAYPLKEYVLGDMARNLWILFGAVGLVLLIACANVANLFLVRLEGRRRELVIRAALGAGRGAIARQFLAESLVLALAGGALAVVVAFWSVEWVAAVAPPSFPRLESLRLGVGTVLFVAALSVGTACLLALFPILRHGRGSVTRALADGGRSSTAGRERQRVRSGLVVAQVALALVLVVGAGLLLESFRRLRSVDPGVRPDGVLTLQIYLPARYETMEQWWRFYDAVTDRIEALPGVRTAAGATALPFTGSYGCTVQGFEDAAVYERLEQADATTCAGQEVTLPGFFEALGIPLLQGRTFTEADNDNPGAGAVVVSRAFAERFWPGEDPIGKGVGPGGSTRPPFYRVVGVVGDAYSNSVDEDPAVAIYYPVVPIPESGRSWWPEGMYLVVRTDLADPASLFPAIRREIAAVDPAIPLANAEPMTEVVAQSMSRVSFVMALLAVAAAVALLLAAVGLYGVMSYVVARRTTEIGVRIAIGAQPGQVARQVVTGSLGLVAVGLGLGALVALAVTRVMRGLLYGIAPTHPAAYLLALAVLASVGLLAAWLPARRAARVDPMVAIRAD